MAERDEMTSSEPDPYEWQLHDDSGVVRTRIAESQLFAILRQNTEEGINVFATNPARRLKVQITVDAWEPLPEVQQESREG
jgi:hypothetical protein